MDKSYYKLIYVDKYSGRVMKMTFKADFMDDVVKRFQEFLLGVGFHPDCVNSIQILDKDDEDQDSIDDFED